MAGTQSVLADDQRLLGIPRSRQTVAIIYPQYGTVLQGFPATFRPGPDRAGAGLPHRANVVRVRPRTSGSITDLLLALACVHFGSVHSTSEKRLNSGFSGDRGRQHRAGGAAATRAHGPRRDRRADDAHHTARDREHPAVQALPDANPRLVGGRYLTRYRNQPDKSLHQSGAAMHHRPQDQERALNLSIPAASGPGNIPRVESN